ncbi:VOC family protein [Streptomyces vinaceus]|uniref:VOC family protein n=1 Tax=Streptomyces vinaceus TaxID=1960 RepID=A0A5J6JFQ8_STRVI|nr:VOC family protein [Streptomyces vinaceus]QEV49385.1 VOC family protein [Streptomyces vinaceus]GHE44983.1 glyoxalase [Streptomyces vinaceus]
MIDTDAGSAVSGKDLSYAIWAQDGGELANFYAAALGAQVAEPYREEHGRPAAFPVGVGDMMYVFWSAATFKARTWPQDELAFHMDIGFGDVEAAEERLLGLGATMPAHQPGEDLWTVLLDPSGQPFCVSSTH